MSRVEDSISLVRLSHSWGQHNWRFRSLIGWVSSALVVHLSWLFTWTSEDPSIAMSGVLIPRKRRDYINGWFLRRNNCLGERLQTPCLGSIILHAYWLPYHCWIFLLEVISLVDVEYQMFRHTTSSYISHYLVFRGSLQWYHWSRHLPRSMEPFSPSYPPMAHCESSNI